MDYGAPQRIMLKTNSNSSEMQMAAPTRPTGQAMPAWREDGKTLHEVLNACIFNRYKISSV